MAAVSLVDIGSLDLAAGEPLRGFDNGAQRVTVIRIAGQRSDVQHELATRGPRIGGDDGSLHTELIRGAGLALADALHLLSVEGIQLPTALALLLGTDLIGARERPGVHRLQVRVASDLAPDVANNAPKADAQNAQFSTVAVELFGMGIASRAARLAMRTYDCRSCTPCFLARRVSPLIAACNSLASVGKVTFLGCTVVSTVTRAKSLVRCAPLSCATRKRPP